MAIGFLNSELLIGLVLLKCFISFATLAVGKQIARRSLASLQYMLLPLGAILQWFACFAALAQTQMQHILTSPLHYVSLLFMATLKWSASFTTLAGIKSSRAPMAARH